MRKCKAVAQLKRKWCSEEGHYIEEISKRIKSVKKTEGRNQEELPYNCEDTCYDSDAHTDQDGYVTNSVDVLEVELETK